MGFSNNSGQTQIQPSGGKGNDPGMGSHSMGGAIRQAVGNSGNSITTPATSQQPSFGQPNNYPNTVGGWDNAQIGTQATGQSSGKGGKGQQQGWQPSPVVNNWNSQPDTAIANPVTQAVAQDVPQAYQGWSATNGWANHH